MEIEILLGNNVSRYVRNRYLSDADVCVGIRFEESDGNDLYFFGWSSPVGELFTVCHLDPMVKDAIEKGDFSFEALLDVNWMKSEFYYQEDRGVTMAVLICKIVGEYHKLMKKTMTEEKLAELEARLDEFTYSVVLCFNDRTMSQSYNLRQLHCDGEKAVSRVSKQQELRYVLDEWMARISFHTPYAYSGQILNGGWRSLGLITYKNHVAVKKADCLKAGWISENP